MPKQDAYSRENIVAAINLVGGLTATEKRALLEKMTADVERLAAETRSAPTSTPVISTNGD